MIKRDSFVSLFFAVYCPLVILTTAILYSYSTYELFLAFVYGSVFSALTGAVSVYVSLRIIDKSISLLLTGVFGGMFIRFIIVVAVSVYVVLKSDFNLLGFFLGFFSSLIILQILDVIYLLSRFGNKKVGENENS